MWQYDESFVTVTVGPTLHQSYTDAGRAAASDSGYDVWPSRVMANIYQNNLSPNTALAKVNGELRTALGLYPSPPSRDQIINVNGSFCNLYDSDGIPIFDAFIDYLILNNPTKALDWVTKLKNNNATHINLDISGDYNENLGWAPRYPIPGSDWTQKLDEFSTILNYVIKAGFVPIVHLAADGQEYDSNGMTYGWDWGMQNIPKIINALSSFVPYCLWTPSWDGGFPNWTKDQTVQMLKLMRSVLGANACIAAEFAGPGTIGYCHMGNGSADWNNNQLDILDAFFVELLSYPADPVGVSQVATRLLGSLSENCPHTPYYLNGQKSVGIIFFETVAYQFIRKQLNEDDVRNTNLVGSNYGFRLFGNGTI